MAEKTNATFAELLRRARSAAGMTQEDLAEQSGLSVRAISNLERGINQAPRKSTIDLLADALGISNEERSLWNQLQRQLGRRSSSADAVAERHAPFDRRILPAPSGSFIGRDPQINDIVELLQQPDVRMVTLTGTGGIGKTRLAIAVANQVPQLFPDGVIFVDLSSVQHPGFVISTIARELNVPEQIGQPPLERVVDALAQRRMLIILDNFERVLAAGQELSELLELITSIKVLVTSQVRVNIRGENVYTVPPLDVPSDILVEDDQAAETLSGYGSVALFVDRVRSMRSDFTLTLENTQAVAEICRILAGVPLAIELAAARSRVLTPQMLLERLDHPLSLLIGGPRDAPDRQRTIRATTQWSFDLLQPSEQTFFVRLGVFVGGWTLAAAEAIVDIDGELDINVLDGLSALIDASMITQAIEPNGEIRFGMLEVLHELARERIEGSTDSDTLRRRHAEYFLQHFAAAETEWSGPDAAFWAAKIKAEIGNLRSALSWAVAHDVEIALRHIQVIAGCWETLGYFSEARNWCELALMNAESASPLLRAYALFEAGFLATTQGDYAAGQSFTEAGLAVYRSHGDASGVVWCLYGLGRVAMWSGDIDRAVQLYEDTIAAARDVAHWPIHIALGNLGAVLIAQGDYTRADVYLSDAIDRAGQAGHLVGLGFILPEYALLAIQQGDLNRARERLLGALEIQQQLLDVRYAAQAIEVAAWIAIAAHQPLRAARLLGGVHALREEISVRIPPATLRYYDTYVSQALRETNQQAWDTAWSHGQLMTLDEILEDAMQTGVSANELE